MAYKNYTVLLEKTSSLNIGDYDKIVKVSSTEYGSLSAPILAKQSYVPSRAVTSLYSSSFTRIATYQLTDAEAATFRSDPNIKLIQRELDDSDNDPSLRHIVGPNTASDNDYGADNRDYAASIDPDGGGEESFTHANFRVVRGSISSTAYWNLPQEDLKILGNYALYLHTLPSESIYSSSTDNYFGNETYNLVSGYNDGVDSVDPSHENLDVANYAINGRNVDVVIMEGSSNPWRNYDARQKTNNSAMDFAHPDWYGLDGKHRVQFIDWTQYTGIGSPNGGTYAPARAWSGGSSLYDGTGHAHRQMVASSAVGVYNGFAKGANIYFYPASPGSSASVNGLINFHKTKPINPETGRRNPTVVNLSVGYIYQHPYLQYELGNLASGSFTFTEEMQGNGKGFRIAWEGPDIIFVSQSGTRPRANININGRDAGATKAAVYNVGAAGIWYYSGSGLSGLQDVINNNINHWFTASVDISTNQIHLTMSSDGYRAANPKIYTGSLTDFINVDGYPGPRGGEFLTEFSGGYAPNTHISKVVVKGQTVLTGSNLFVNSQHGYNPNPPVDHYGIDRKDSLNVRLDPLKDNGIVDASHQFPAGGTGRTRGELRTFCALNSGFGDEKRTLTNALWDEAAEAGIIAVTSAGNNTQLSTGGPFISNEENPFYDPEFYDDDLYNTYIEIDIDYNYPLVTQDQGPHTPLRFHGTSIVNNYQMIQVGMLTYIVSSAPYQNNINTVSTDLKVGSAWNNIVTNPTTDKNQTGFRVATFTGAGVDVYAHSREAMMAGWYGYDSTNNDKSAPTCSFYNQISFDTKKINDVYTQSFMDANFFSSSLNFEFPPFQSNGDFYFDPQGCQSNTQGGGTSNASPRVAGMVACYLQVNPNANLKDVRNWLKSISVEMPTSHDTSSAFYTHNLGIVTSSTDPLKYEQIYYPTGSNTSIGLDIGPRPGRIPIFPYNQKEPVTFTGSLNIEGLNFELQ